MEFKGSTHVVIPHSRMELLKGKTGTLQKYTTTTGGYIVIQISSQTTKKEVFENPHLRTITPRKLLSVCDTITFAPVQSQVLHNS
jgi:hypothetical protein